MQFAARLFSAFLGLAVVGFLLWAIDFPFGAQEARQPERSLFPPQPKKPSSPQVAPKPPPAESVASTQKPPMPDSTKTIPDPAPPLLAQERAEAERQAALQQKAETVAKPKPKTQRFYRVVVRDGESLRAGDTVVTLAGISGQSADATCKDERGKAWPCGARARMALTRLIRSRAVTCEVPAGGNPKLFTSRCSVGDTDLSTWMVLQGWATPKEPAEQALADAAETAQQNRLGIWRTPAPSP
ncbi:MAG: thermonuclease family protein [Methyloceanibacter sp.]